MTKGKKFWAAALGLSVLAGQGGSVSRADDLKVGSEFTYTVQGNVFHITLNEYFPASVLLDDTRKDYQDSDLQVEVSRFVAHMYKTPNDPEATQFQIKTSSHMLSFLYTTNECTAGHDAGKWWQSCQIENNFIDRQVFKNAYGKSSVSCAQEGPQAVCQFLLEGEPAGLPGKSPKHLAAAGATETLHDLTAIFMILRGTAHDAGDARNQVVNTELGRSIDQIVVDADAHSGADLTITGSDIGGAPRHQLTLN